MASPPRHLQAKFQIGSCKGRMNYEDGERVFHPSDVPQKAKEAKKAVKESLRSEITSNHPSWNQTTLPGKYVSGSRAAPWDKDAFDNRYYSEQETKARHEREKQHKENLIYDLDRPPAWNSSTLCEPLRSNGTDRFFKENRAWDGTASLRFGNELYEPVVAAPEPTGIMSTTNGRALIGSGQPVVRPIESTQIGKASAKPKSKLPKNYVSLVDRQIKEQEKQRLAKMKQRELEAEKARVKSSPQWDDAFAYPSHVNFEGKKRPTNTELQEQFDQTYTPDALTKYLESLDSIAATAREAPCINEQKGVSMAAGTKTLSEAKTLVAKPAVF